MILGSRRAQVVPARWVRNNLDDARRKYTRAKRNVELPFWAIIVSAQRNRAGQHVRWKVHCLVRIFGCVWSSAAGDNYDLSFEDRVQVEIMREAPKMCELKLDSKLVTWKLESNLEIIGHQQLVAYETLQFQWCPTSQGRHSKSPSSWQEHLR